jgi:hypothetical protein
MTATVGTRPPLNKWDRVTRKRHAADNAVNWALYAAEAPSICSRRPSMN